MKVFVVGSRGFLGRRLVSSLAGRFDVHAVSSSGAPGTMFLDLERAADFDYAQLSIDDIVIVTSAISSPDICARDPDRAYRVNVAGTTDFVARAIAQGSRVIFFSSDTVLGGCEDPTDETAPLAPFGPYAEMKAEVERRFEADHRFIRMRLSYVVASDDKFTSYLLTCAKEKQTAELFDPLLRRAVAITDVVEAVTVICEDWSRLSGNCINLAGPQLLSRVEIANALNVNLSTRFEFSVVTPNESFYLARPRTINMVSRYLKHLLRREPLTIEQAYNSWFAKG